MATPRMDITSFVGKLLEEDDVDLLREGVRVLAQAVLGARALVVDERRAQHGELRVAEPRERRLEPFQLTCATYQNWRHDRSIEDHHPSKPAGQVVPCFTILRRAAGLAGLPVFCCDIPPLRSLGGEQAVYFSPDANPQKVAVRVADRLTIDPVFELRQRVRKSFTWEHVYREKIAPLFTAG